MKKILIAAAFALALPAFAQTNAGLGVSGSAHVSGTLPGTSVQAQGQVRADLRSELIGKAQTRADEEINRRIDALTKLSARVNAMKRISDSGKASLSASLQAQISAMNDLKARVDADANANSTTSLKTDIKSITASYRIYMLIMPQAAINAAADRVMTIFTAMNDLGTKLQARINAAQAAGKDTTAAGVAMADFNAKVSDANVQAQAAITAIANLSPDQGDPAKLQANTTILKDARAKITTAQKDLAAARADAQTIVRAIALWKVKASAGASTTVSQ